MVAIPDVAVGALITYGIVLHLYLAYLYGAREAGEGSVNAQEADTLASE